MMLKLELLRIIKSRSTRYLSGAALLLSVLLAGMTIFMSYYYDSATGTSRHGLAAIAAERAEAALSEGEITPEKIREAYAVNQELSRVYGQVMPTEVWNSKMKPVYNTILNTRLVFFETNGMPKEPTDISPEEASNFYSQRKDYINKTIYYGHQSRQDVADYALRLDERVETPFVYQYGFGSSNTLAYLTVCVFILVVICSVISAPVFSSDYASGADDIQRCTRNGRRKLAHAKLLSVIIISSALFFLCTGVFLAITLPVFGLDGTSVQFNYSTGVLAFTNMSENGFLILILISGFLTVLAMICLTLWLSSILNSPVMVLAISVGIALLPSLISVIGDTGNLVNWIRLCLPSGGTGLANMFTELGQGTFLTAGPLIVWSPHLMLAAALLEIPVFYLLARRCYIKHEL